MLKISIREPIIRIFSVVNSIVFAEYKTADSDGSVKNLYLATIIAENEMYTIIL